MKIFSIFMAFFILAMAVDFCCEENTLGGVEKKEISDNGHSEKEYDDVCSPFCHCSRCCFSTVFPLGTVQSGLFASLKINYSRVGDRHIFHPDLSVWQPPRIASS